MLYRIGVGTGLAWPWHKVVEAFSEQEAVDEVADFLEAEGSAYVKTYTDLLKGREKGKSAADVQNELNLTCCGNHGIYMEVVSIEKLPFTDFGVNAYKSAEMLTSKEKRLEWARLSAYNLAAYHLYEDQERAYGAVEEIKNSTYLSSKEPYLHLNFGPTEVLKELEAMLLPEAIPEKEFKLPVVWQLCGMVTVKARSISDAIEKFKEDIDDIELPRSFCYVVDSFKLSTEEEGTIALYNK